MRLASGLFKKVAISLALMTGGAVVGPAVGSAMGIGEPAQKAVATKHTSLKDRFQNPLYQQGLEQAKSEPRHTRKRETRKTSKFHRKSVKPEKVKSARTVQSSSARLSQKHIAKPLTRDQRKAQFEKCGDEYQGKKKLQKRTMCEQASANGRAWTFR